MKLAIWYNLPSGGAKRALYCHVQGLIKRGHHVEVWCPPVTDHSFSGLDKLVKENCVPVEWLVDNRRGRLKDLTTLYMNIVSQVKAAEAHAEKCAEQISKGNFDALFAHNCKYMYAPHIGKYLSLPKVLYLHEPCRSLYEAMPQLPWSATAHNPTPYFSKRNPRSSLISSFYRLRTDLIEVIGVQGLRVKVREEVLNASSFDKILVNSFFSRESVLRAYGLNAEVCYLGIDTSVFVSTNETRENYVVGLGSYNPTKSQKLVIEVLSRIPEPRPRLVWVGNFDEGGFYNEIVQYAKSLNVDLDAKINVSDSELLTILNKAYLMIYAPRLEPFGFAPLEANACATPVIAVAEGGIRETIVDGLNGWVVEPEVEVLAQTLYKLLQEPEKVREVGNNAYRMVHDKWSLEQANDRLEKKLLAAIEKHK